MDDFKFQKRVRQHRLKQGMSQEELADKAKLSLRTIQRIENGENAPRGDTLKRLATALGVSPEELIDWQVNADDNLLTIFNLSQLGFLAFPLLGVIIPLTLWILKKEKIKYVDSVGRSILNFQITWNLLLFSVYSLGLLFILVQGRVHRLLFLAYAISTGGLYFYNVLQIILNTVRCRKKYEVRYSPAIRFLK